ncbi:permease-like cell division protein FtsX [Nonomuraea sp. NPDC050786]|uniref:permease-like cell division protein FtsX n=1 Tax=Nonomuraea sp. NPDC050786 TaxID=3154840 RepID=UPI00340C6C57
MTSRVEDRLREALVEAGATVDTGALRPLREPQGRRFRADFRLVTAAAAVVVLAGAATAVWLVGSGDENRAVAAGPGPAGSTEVAVFLCTKSAQEPKCQGRDATREEKDAINRTLSELSQIKEMVFREQGDAYRDFRAAFAHNKAVLDAVKATDVPRSFWLKLREGADWRDVEKALRGTSGVLGVVQQAPPLAETRQSLISVFLCGKESSLPACGAKREPAGKGGFKVTKEGKAVTLAQMRALERTIKAMPGVQSLVFEDKTASYEKFRRQFSENKALLQATKVEDMPEVFRLTLQPEADWAPLVSKLRRQPGVATVQSPCLVDRAVLMSAYGVSLPQSKVCPLDK